MDYYATLVQEGLNYQPVTLILRKIQLDPVPIFNGGQGSKCVKHKCTYYCYLKITRNLYIYFNTILYG